MKVNTWNSFLPSCLHISTYLQTSVREERSQSPSLLESRDTSHTRCPEGEKMFQLCIEQKITHN